MSIVYETVENGVGIGWVANDLMPFLDRKLTGDDGRSAAVSFFEDFQKIVVDGGIERRQSPIVENAKIDTPERAQQARMAAVTPRQGEFGKEPGHTLIENRAIAAASGVAECLRQPAFTGTSRPGNHEIGVIFDPLPTGELLEQGAVETVQAAIIDIFNACLLTQLGVTQPCGEPFVVSPGGFAFKQKSQPFSMAQRRAFPGRLDLAEGLGHAVKTERKDARGIAQLLRMGWHRPGHCKPPPSPEVRALLTARKPLLSKAIDGELGIRGRLRGSG